MATDLTLRPTSDEDINIGVQYPDSGSHFEKVDEAAADDDTTYLKQGQAGVYGDTKTDYLGVENASVYGDINHVRVYIRGKENSGWFKPGIKTHSTDYLGTARAPDMSYTTYYDEWTTNPNTGLAWTWEEIDALQLIIVLHSFADPSGSKYAVATQAYVVVNYDPVVAPTVTTQAVSDILSTTATGNGNITLTDNANCTRRGVCYMEGSSGDPTTANSVAYDDGDFGTGAFTKGMTGLSPGTTYRVRAYAVNPAGVGYGTTVQFTTDKVAPTVTTQSPTDVLPTTVTANGNITALGGENATVRGFKYGLTQVDTWNAHDNGSFSAGAYTKGLTGLDANTTYWIRAYATNSIGTNYGDWVEFQTAASGTIPTGTKLDICSDYSGYTYQLQRSSNDDGSAYTAYFVISTDLSNKQGLAYYKRILDLWLYFNSEASGTATITVKRDNEADWQAVGSVSLTGTADIIVQHLATRIYGKHFLFKISAANHFEFLGCLFEYIPKGMR